MPDSAQYWPIPIANLIIGETLVNKPLYCNNCTISKNGCVAPTLTQIAMPAAIYDSMNKIALGNVLLEHVLCTPRHKSHCSYQYGNWLIQFSHQNKLFSGYTMHSKLIRSSCVENSSYSIILGIFR